MDIQKEREEFELSFKETDFYKMNLVNCFCFIADRYVWDEVQAAWEMWQTAIARMEVRINTLDEMLLNQGEALAQAKAQAVPEGFALVKKVHPDAIVHNQGLGLFKECQIIYGWDGKSKDFKDALNKGFYHGVKLGAKAVLETAMIEAAQGKNT